MDHYGDGIRRYQSSPAVSDGGVMNPGRIADIMILSSDSEEAQWEQMWKKFQCAVLIVCTIPMSTRTQSSTGRRHNGRVMRWNNIVRNLVSRIAGRMILMDLEHELRALDQARFTTVH